MRAGGLIQAPGRPGEIRDGRGWRGRPRAALGPRSIVAAPYGSDFSAPGPRDSYGRENANVRGYGGGGAPAILAVASGGAGDHFLVSEDAVTWTAMPAPAALSWWCCAYSPTLGLYAVGARSTVAQRVYTSPDLVNWTPRTLVDASRWPVRMVWSASLGLFAVSTEDGTNFTSADRFFGSVDGVTWQPINLSLGAWNNAVQGDIRSNELGANIHAFGSGGGSWGCAISPGGLATYVRNDTVNSSGVRGGCWDSTRGRWCIVNTANNVFTSPSGQSGSWTQRAANPFGGSDTQRCIAYCPAADRILSGGLGGGSSFMWESTDGGSTWAQVAGLPFTTTIQKIEWLPTYGVLVALSTSGVIIATSPTGAGGTWTARFSGNQDMRGVTII